MMVESQRSPSDTNRQETIRAGNYWMHGISAGSVFRIHDTEGNQAVDTLFYSLNDPSEHYSAADTIREQGNVYLTAGSVLMSNQVKPMLEICLLYTSPSPRDS